jgi:hypothetical protein
LRFLTSKHPISISIALLGPLQIPHHNTLHPLPILLSPFLRSRKPSKTPCSPQQVSASRTSGSIPYALSKKTSPRIPAHGRVRCLRGLGVTGTITRKLSVGSNNTAKLPKGCRHLELCTSVKIRCSGPQSWTNSCFRAGLHFFSKYSGVWQATIADIFAKNVRLST